MAEHSEYDREPIFWIVKLLRARERFNSTAEREAQLRLKRLGVHIRFADTPAAPKPEARP